jgi:acetyltransferase-like isoleucine patch superfamily enzyme
MKKNDLKVRKIITEGEKSKIQHYQELVVGKTDFLSLIKYETIMTLVSGMPGAIGILLRSKLYPKLLGRAGQNVVFGRNVTLRHPHKIFIGSNVVIDENCLLDAKGIGNAGIFIGSNVFLGRNSILSCKDGEIHLEDGVNIGFNCEVFSSSQVILRKNALVAAYCYLIGGGNYRIDDFDTPFAEQCDFSEDRGIEIDQNVWLAAGVKVLDGVTVGENSVVGAGAVVRDSIPDWSIAAGIPAKVIRSRKESQRTRPKAVSNKPNMSNENVLETFPSAEGNNNSPIRGLGLNPLNESNLES